MVLAPKAERYARARATRARGPDPDAAAKLDAYLEGADPQMARIIRSNIAGANADWRDDNDVDDVFYQPPPLDRAHTGNYTTMVTRTPVTPTLTTLQTEVVYSPHMLGQQDSPVVGRPTVLPSPVVNMMMEDDGRGVGLDRLGGFDATLFRPRQAVTATQETNDTSVSADVPSRASVEPGLILTHAPYFTGNVDKEVGALMDWCRVEQDADSEVQIEAALTWSTLSAAGPLPPSVINRRELTGFGKLTEGEVPSDKLQDMVSSRKVEHRHQEREGAGQPSRTVIATERKTRRTYALTARAAEVGRKTINSYRRVIGLLENGSANRKWTVALCRWWYSQPSLPAAKAKWIEAIKQDKGITPEAAKPIADRIYINIKLWAKQVDTIPEFTPDNETKQQPTTGTTCIDTETATPQELGATFVIFSKIIYTNC